MGRMVTQENRGIDYVKDIINSYWLCDFQALEQSNDEGEDAYVMMRKGKERKKTPGFFKVQIKCGDSYIKCIKKRAKYLNLNLGYPYDKHKEKWQASREPMILIYVTNKKKSHERKAWWVDLRHEKTYCKDNKSLLLIPKSQRFGEHTKGDLLKLCKVNEMYDQAKEIIVNKEELSFFNSAKVPIKKIGREFYKEWSAHETIHEKLGKITVNRVGWRHLIRRGRPFIRIINSILLLPAAKKMLGAIDEYQRLGNAQYVDYEEFSHPKFDEACRRTLDYLGIRAKVDLPYRGIAYVQVVLKRIKINSLENGDKLAETIYFYSVYEKKR